MISFLVFVFSLPLSIYFVAACLSLLDLKSQPRLPIFIRITAAICMGLALAWVTQPHGLTALLAALSTIVTLYVGAFLMGKHWLRGAQVHENVPQHPPPILEQTVQSMPQKESS